MQETNISINEIIMYLRKSRSDDPYMTVEEVLARHERQLQEYALSSFGSIIPEERIFREVVSGETIADRPVMQSVMKYLESGQIKGVLVIEPQRLSRGDLEDCGRIINAFRYTNTLVLTPPKTYDLSDEYDRKFFEMELTRGNDYLEYTKKILNRGRLASVKQGNYIGSIAPYGYRKIKTGSGKDTAHTLEIVPEQADAVRMMAQLYLAGNGFTRIAVHLDSLGIKPLKSDHWSPAAISDILSNPVYIGMIRWNHFKTIKTMQNGQIVKSRPTNHDTDYILVPGKHPAILDQGTFDAIAQRRGKSPKIKRGHELRNPFAGLVYCGTAGCGRSMTFKQFTNYQSKVPRRSESMICPNQRICHTKSVQYSAFVERVKEILSKTVDDFEIKLQNDDGNIVRIHENIIRNLEQDLVKLKDKDLRQKDAYEDGIYTKEEYASRNAKLQEQICEVQLSIQRAKDTMPPEVDYQERVSRFSDCLSKFEDTDISASEMNLLLKSCIEKIIYHNSSESKPGIGRFVANPFELDIYLRL